MKRKYYLYNMIIIYLYYIRPSFIECGGYDIKQSDGEALVFLEIYGMRSIHYFAIAPSSILAQLGNTWLGPIYGSNRTAWHTCKYLTLLTYDYLSYVSDIYIYMSKADLALNNLQWLIRHKTKPIQILKNTPITSLLRGKSTLTSVLYMTLNNLIRWSFRECWVPHRSQVHSVLISFYIWVREN